MLGWASRIRVLGWEVRACIAFRHRRFGFESWFQNKSVLRVQDQGFRGSVRILHDYHGGRSDHMRLFYLRKFSGGELPGGCPYIRPM